MAQSTAENVTPIEDVWDLAHQENLDRDHAAAIIKHEQYKADLQAEMDQARADTKAKWEQTEAARKAKAERLKLVGPDKLMIQLVAESFDDWASNCFTPHLETQEAMSAYHDLITRIKSAINCFEQAGKDLV